MRLFLTLFFCICSFGQTILIISNNKPTKEEERIASYISKWGPAFNLENWAIDLKMVTQEEIQIIHRKPAAALSSWRPAERYGVMLVLKKDDYIPLPRSLSIQEDQEDSVVHEMLHNVFQNMPQEHAVQIISRLLTHPDSRKAIEKFKKPKL